MVRPDARIACLFCFLLGCGSQGSDAFHSFEAVQKPPVESSEAVTSSSGTALETSPTREIPVSESPVQAAKTEVMPTAEPVREPDSLVKLSDSASATAPPLDPVATTPAVTLPLEVIKPLKTPQSPLAMAAPGAVAPVAASATPMGPLPIKLLVPQKEFVAEGSEKTPRVSFDDLDLLKVLNMEPVPPDAEQHFPDWLKSLNGKRIILRGWMFPAGRTDGISSFLFVRDNGICCFGRSPKVYDKLGVKLRPGITTHYIQNRPFDVIGTLSIEPEIEGADEGNWWLYFLNDAVVVEN